MEYLATTGYNSYDIRMNHDCILYGPFRNPTDGEFLSAYVHAAVMQSCSRAAIIILVILSHSHHRPPICQSRRAAHPPATPHEMEVEAAKYDFIYFRWMVVSYEPVGHARPGPGDQSVNKKMRVLMPMKMIRCSVLGTFGHGKAQKAKIGPKPMTLTLASIDVSSR